MQIKTYNFLHNFLNIKKNHKSDFNLLFKNKNVLPSSFYDWHKEYLEQSGKVSFSETVYFEDLFDSRTTSPNILIANKIDFYIRKFSFFSIQKIYEINPVMDESKCHHEDIIFINLKVGNSIFTEVFSLIDYNKVMVIELFDKILNSYHNIFKVKIEIGYIATPIGLNFIKDINKTKIYPMNFKILKNICYNINSKYQIDLKEQINHPDFFQSLALVLREKKLYEQEFYLNCYLKSYDFSYIFLINFSNSPSFNIKEIELSLTPRTKNFIIFNIYRLLF